MRIWPNWYSHAGAAKAAAYYQKLERAPRKILQLEEITVRKLLIRLYSRWLCSLRQKALGISLRSASYWVVARKVWISEQDLENLLNLNQSGYSKLAIYLWMKNTQRVVWVEKPHETSLELANYSFVANFWPYILEDGATSGKTAQIEPNFKAWTDD